jgi:hypothetical protein
MKSSNEFESVVVNVVATIVVVGHGLKLLKPQSLQFLIPPVPQPNPTSIGGLEEHSVS